MVTFILMRFQSHSPAKFLDNFVERDQTRFEMGCKNYRVFKHATNEKIITLLIEWDNRDNYIKYMKYFKDTVVKYTEHYAEEIEMRLLTSIQNVKSKNNFYVLSKFTVEGEIRDPNKLAKEMEQNYGHEILKEIKCEGIEVFTNVKNINIVSILGKWKSKEAYFKWYNSLTHRNINKLSDAQGREYGSDHYRLRLIRSNYYGNL